MITQNINGKYICEFEINLGMDLTMRFGGDETCFLFNLTQNLRFDTLKHSELNG
jgi:hypothetical protein